MKKLSTLTLGLFFAAGSAFAQSNEATVSQAGDQNEATIQQVYQAGGSGDNNEAFTTQTGNLNVVAGLKQRGAGNWHGIVQTGDNNLVDRYPNQGSSQGGSYDGYISITQLGDDNKVWDADQAGSENSLTVTQRGGDIVNVEAQISPEGGVGNAIVIDQYGGGNAVGEFSPNGSGAYQEGEGNSMDITQDGGAKAGIASVYVSGATEKFFRSAIEGGQGLIQLGDDNMLTIEQDGASTVGFVIQKGDLNKASVYQTGDLNTATVSQVGNSNEAIITQSGI
ncbi:hypothetical protein [Rhodohalobacter sp. 8-1]|uniref:hypothetical protein n=1 Tax=Rhodohalobacter sp. 8-1 TaxID=3131972 RepID=UPI0030EED0F5